MSPPSVDLCRSSATLLRLCLLFAACLMGSLVHAAAPVDDDDDAPVPEGPEAKPAKPRSEDPPAADDELLEAVEPKGKGAAGEEIDRLERAISGMWSAKKRIDGSDTGQKTQDIQNQVVNDLEELLALLKKQQQNRQNSSLPNQDQRNDKNQSPNQRQKTRKGQGDPSNSGAKKDAEPNGRRSDGKPSDSQERSDAARAAADEARRTQMIKDVWGHLPPHLRTAMQNAFSENFLPQYEDLVKKYYEALAEKNRKRTEK